MLNLHRHSGVALIDASTGREIGYAELREAAQARMASVRERALVMLFADLSVATVESYIGALLGGHVIALLDARMQPLLKARVLRAYRPSWIAGPEGLGRELTAAGVGIADGIEVRDGELLRPAAFEPPTLHPNLALLLGASGTTGSSKFVRLSRRNVEANAEAIAEYLSLTAEERAVSSLPLHYSYGLSVLNSHLWTGGTMVLTAASLVQPAFWDAFDRYRCTSLAGVPFSYQMLERVGFRERALPSLRTMTQAGGALDKQLTATYSRHMQVRGGRFFAMYGQTEATARIAYLPPEQLPHKLGSAGIAIPGGRLLIDSGQGATTDPGVTGEVVYRGPNVMQGYADCGDDLVRSDELGGELCTGDLGYLDDDGYLFLVGRSKRIAKIVGLRVNLDEFEVRLREHGPAAALAGPDTIIAACAFGDDEGLRELARSLAREFGVNHKAIDLRRVDEIAVTSSGKIDYKRVEQWLST